MCFGGQVHSTVAGGEEKKSLRRPKTVCIKGRSRNWKARGLTGRPSRPIIDTASLGESQKQIKWGASNIRESPVWNSSLDVFRDLYALFQESLITAAIHTNKG
eukprot:1151224-Pelagomonas_calceolata.AAC.2